MSETSWQPYDGITLDEKIRRTKKAIQEFSVYEGGIAQAMLKNKKLLLVELEKAKTNGQ